MLLMDAMRMELKQFSSIAPEFGRIKIGDVLKKITNSNIMLLSLL